VPARNPLNDHSPDNGMLRCALSASDNSLKSLEHYVAGLGIDYRDVILAAEYTQENGENIRIRDLSKPVEVDAVYLAGPGR